MRGGVSWQELPFQRAAVHQAGIQASSGTNSSCCSGPYPAAACEESPLTVAASPACQHLQKSSESRTFVDMDCLVQVCLERVEAVSQLCARLRPPCNNPQMLPALLAKRHSTLQDKLHRSKAAWELQIRRPALAQHTHVYPSSQQAAVWHPKGNQSAAGSPSR